MITKTKILTALCPIVTSTTLTKNEIVGTEKTTERARANRVHSSGLQVNQDRTGNIFVGANFVIVDRDALELKVIVALVLSVALDSVLI